LTNSTNNYNNNNNISRNSIKVYLCTEPKGSDSLSAVQGHIQELPWGADHGERELITGV